MNGIDSNRAIQQIIDKPGNIRKGQPKKQSNMSTNWGL